MRLAAVLRRLLGRDELPAGFTGRLAPDERVLATAALAGGGHVVVTSLGMWLPADGSLAGPSMGTDGSLAGPSMSTADAARRLGWHLVTKAAWSGGAITLVEAAERAAVGGVVLLADRPPRRLRLVEPGRVPEVVHERVTASIRSRQHRELPDGGAWIVVRKVPGRDGSVVQVRPDPGTDEAAAHEVAADVARSLGHSDIDG